MPSSIRRAAAASVLLPTLLVASACSDGPSEPRPDGRFPSSIQLMQAPAPAWSGEPTSLAVRVLAQDGLPLAGAALTLEPEHGSVPQSTATTDEQGVAPVSWHLADQDRRQVLRVRGGNRSLEVAVTSTPLITAVVLQGLPATLPLGDTTAQASLQARTSTGRELPFPGLFTLTLESQVPRYPALPVGAVTGRRVRATGPGAMDVRATAGELASDVVSIEVPHGRPIVLRVTPEGVASAGGEVTLEGYDLEAVAPDAVRLDGEPVALLATDAESIRLLVPPAPTDCRGRDVVALTVAQAYLPQGPLTLRRSRDGTLVLAPGEVLPLGRASGLCVRLRGEPDAEYVLAYFDARGIESARTTPEDGSLDNAAASVRLADRSVPGAAGTVRPAAPAGASLSADAPSDVVRGTPVAGASPYDLLWNVRQTPWAVGDTFAIWGDEGRIEPGVIFHATARFAVGAMARDSSYRIPQRLIGVSSALEKFGQHAELMGSAFGVDWPATTAGAGQTLVIVGDFWAAGLMFLGSGTVDRGNFVAIDPLVVELPASEPLHFPEYTLFHEMAHAYQDRYMMKRCVELGDCGYDVWDYRWSVEGGADFLTQQLMRIELGFALNGNYSLDGIVSNALGPLIYYGDFEHPHYVFSEGYGASSWLLTDLLHRALAAGAAFDAAMGAIAMGALEGWYGKGRDGVQRPGLAARTRTLLGNDWEPLPATLQALLALGADDRISSGSLQVPFVSEAWNRIRPGGTFRLGDGLAIDVAVRGLTYGHYRIEDAAGLGGAIEAATPGAPMEWAIVRTR
ncbi:MAG TPA: hypothetical protein VK939_17270 [Longimicrobiales bacterium]|nr:hypothetical protein [Longimicrobiales bacterium]